MSRTMFTGEFAWGSHKNYSQDRVAKLGEQLEFTWSPQLFESDGVTLTICQEGPDWEALATHPVIGNLTGRQLIWTVTSDGFALDISNIFYMAIKQPGFKDFQPSHYFNISNARIASIISTRSATPIGTSETIISTRSATPTGISQTTEATTTMPTASATPPPTTTVVMQTDSGLRAGEVAGIAVGVVAGAFIIAICVWLVARYWRRRNKDSKQDGLKDVDDDLDVRPAIAQSPMSELSSGAVGSEVSGAETGGRYYRGEDGKMYYYELGGNQAAQEMFGDDVRRVK